MKKRKEKQSLLKATNKTVIFTEAVPAVSQCARSKSASRADVLQAVDKTHPPASKRETADSQLHNYTYNPPTQSVAT